MARGAQKYYRYPTEAETRIAETLVSVIVPIYNTARYLDQALDSIQAQTHQKLEIICLNDGSTDESLAIMQKHAAADPRIRVIDKENEGYGATCNRGIDEAHGTWIAIVEPDDWIDAGMYADMLTFAASFPDTDIDIIKTPYWRIYEPDSPQERTFNCSYRKRIHVEKQPFTVLDAIHLLHHHPSIWSAIYRKSFLDEHQIRFMPIPGAGWADNPFLVETLCQAKKIVYLDAPYYRYREDTKEKTASFHAHNPDVPFDRWNDSLDVIERLGIDDARILCAHYSRGFMYMSGVIEENDPDDPHIHAQIAHMFSRMDPELVMAYPRISPGCKRLFAEFCGLPAPKINHMQYAKNLVEQGIYNLRNVGLYDTADSLTSYLTKYKKRTGGR